METFLKISEAARVLRVSKAELNKAIDAGLIPCVELADTRRVPSSALTPGPGAHPQTTHSETINKVA